MIQHGDLTVKNWGRWSEISIKHGYGESCVFPVSGRKSHGSRDELCIFESKNEGFHGDLNR